MKKINILGKIFKGIQGPAGPVGPMGPQGMKGEDANLNDLSVVAKTGSYNDLMDKPDIDSLINEVKLLKEKVLKFEK